MTNPDPLGPMNLSDRRRVDRIALERRGCRYVDLTDDQARELLYELLAEVEVKQAYIRILEEMSR